MGLYGHIVVKKRKNYHNNCSLIRKPMKKLINIMYIAESGASHKARDPDRSQFCAAIISMITQNSMKYV